MNNLEKKLFKLQDKKFRDFNVKLVNNIDPDTIIGIKTPELKTIAKDLYQNNNYHNFLYDLPHKYFEENQIHAFIISLMKDYDEAMDELEKFLPYIDNWATCDQLKVKCFSKHKDDLLKHINKWLKNKHSYTIRFGIKALMDYYLDEDYDSKYPEMVRKVKSDDYYVKMMQAWYYATALAKQKDDIIIYLQDNKLDDWVHNKTIQKAIESNRISDKDKEYLKTCRKLNNKENFVKIKA